MIIKIYYFNKKNMDNYIFFLGKSKEYGFLSNFYLTKFNEGKINFNMSEQYMMYKKAKLFKDEKTAQKILDADTALGCKKLGRTVKNFDEKTWDENKVAIVTEGLRLKFTQNEDLKNKLLATEDKILAEASPYDGIWGIGIDKETALKRKPEEWTGKNLLGKALMKVREEIKN